jgi:hypothetical protein
MPRGLRWVHVVVHVVTLASALAVLASDLVDPGYAAFYGDVLPFVAVYVAVQAWALWVFARDRPAAPLFTVAKAVAALVLLGSFVADAYAQGNPTGAAPERLAFVNGFDGAAAAWIRLSPARYVYLLFDWGAAAKVGIYGFLLLGRGAFNVVSAFVATDRWWRPLRTTQPILGRFLTMLPVALVVTCTWGFFQLVKLNAETMSADAERVAWTVYRGIECGVLRDRQGTTVTQTLQQGDQRYDARILYGCTETQVVVIAPDGRLGIARGARTDCCATPS